MRYLLIPLLLLLAACNGNNQAAVGANTAPVVVVLSPLADFTVVAGTPLEIRYTDDDPDTEARTTIVAVSIGGVEIIIAANLPEGDGAEQFVIWDTSAVVADVYTIEIRTDDGVTETVEVAPGEVTITAPGQNAGTSFADPTNILDSDLAPGDSLLVTGRLDQEITLGLGRSGETTLTPVGSQDFFVGRYQEDGSLLWARRATNAESLYVVAFPDGSCAVIGYLTDDATFNPGEADEFFLPAVGDANAFVARYGTDGTLLWADAIASEGNLVNLAITAADNGSLIVLGFSLAPVTFNPGRATESVVEGLKTVAAKFDETGSIVWARALDVDLRSEPTAADAFADGSFVVSGVYDFIALAGRDEGDLGGWVARFDADGGLVWTSRAYTATGFLRFLEVAATPAGDVVVCGSYNDNDLTIGGADVELAGMSGAIVARYRGDGAFQWFTEIDAAIPGMRGLAAAPDESCVFCCHYNRDATIDPNGTNEIILPFFGVPGSEMLGTVRFRQDGVPVAVRADAPEGGLRELAGAHVTAAGRPLVVGNFVDLLTVEGKTVEVNGNGFFAAVIENDN